MNPRRLVLLAVSLLCVGLAAGCASFRQNSKDLTVGLVDIRPLETRAFESRLVLTVRVTNASPEPLHLSGSRHRLVINGHALGVAVSPEPLEVPGLSTAVQEATFTLSHLSLIPLANELRREPAAIYEIESTFFGAGVFSRGIDVRQTGRVDLSALAQVPAAAASR